MNYTKLPRLNFLILFPYFSFFVPSRIQNRTTLLSYYSVCRLGGRVCPMRMDFLGRHWIGGGPIGSRQFIGPRNSESNDYDLLYDSV